MPAARISLTFFLFCLLLPLSAAALEPADDADLDSIKARSGIAIAVSDVELYGQKTYRAMADTTTDESRIALEDTAFYYRFNALEPVYLRVFQNQHGFAMAGLEALAENDGAAWAQEMVVESEALVLDDHDLGSLHLADLSPEAFAVYTAPLGDNSDYSGESGVAFQYETRTKMEEFRWQYNESGNDGVFSLGNAYAAREFDDAGNPKGLFAVGSMDPRNENGGEFEPATFRAHQDDQGRPFMRMNMPMEGSIRIEEVEMGGHEIGPVRLEDMEIHHLEVDFIPWQDGQE